MSKQSRSVWFQLGLIFIVLTLAFGLLPISQPAIAADEPAELSVGDDSVLLIENVGQFDDQALFQVWGGSAPMWLVKDGFWVTVVEASEISVDSLGEEGSSQAQLPLTGVNIKVTFVDSNPDPVIEPFDRLETSVNYFRSNDPSQWRTNVPVWGGMRYLDLYPGIDLEVFSESGLTFQRLVVSEGADLSLVKLGVQGADAVSTDNGKLLISTSIGDITYPLLNLAGQISSEIPAPMVSGELVSFPFIHPDAITKNDVTLPEGTRLLYGTFLGGEGRESANSITVNTDDSLYVTGYTGSEDFPITTGAFDTDLNGYDVFVFRMNAQGTRPLFATFIGGNGEDIGMDLKIDSDGVAYITGSTMSSDFPTSENAFDPDFNPSNSYTDAFITVLSANGAALSYSTYLGGSSNDVGTAIDLGLDKSIYITGASGSGDFPLTDNAFDKTPLAGRANFVAKFNLNGSSLDYATRIGGSDGSKDIVVDASGAAYIASKIFGTTTVTENAFDTTQNGKNDAYIAKLSPDGSTLAYGSYFGGSESDEAVGIALDQNGNTYVVGNTYSKDIPTSESAFQKTSPVTCPIGLSCQSAFVVKLDPTGSLLEYGTYLGGSQGSSASALALDSDGKASIVGVTSSSDFPVTPNGFDISMNSFDALFLTSLSASGSALDYSSYIEGSSYDFVHDVSIGTDGSAYIGGYTYSTDFPSLPGSFVSTNNDIWTAYLLKFGEDVLPPEKPTLLSPEDGFSGRGMPVFSWSLQSDATYYVLEYDNDADFSSPVYTSPKQKGGTNQPKREDVGTFYWHVKAQDLVGNWSEWSDPRILTMDPIKPIAPLLYTPFNRTYLSDNTPLLVWWSVPYGYKYQVQTSKDSTFATIELSRTMVPGAVQFTTPKLVEGKHYWRVRALNTLNEHSPWSKVYWFMVDTIPPAKPVLLNPANDSTIKTIPTFRWNALPGAKYYQLVCDFSNGVNYFKTDWFTNTYLIPNAFRYGTFRWHVHAKDAAGNISEWSKYWWFTVK